MKLRKRSRPTNSKYNLRPRTKSQFCRLCGVSSVAEHASCGYKQKKLVPKKQPCQRRKVPQPTTCVICLDTQNAKQSRKVKCGHVFHSKCINSWLKLSDSCPVCRFQLRKSCLSLVQRLTLRISPFVQFHIYG